MDKPKSSTAVKIARIIILTLYILLPVIGFYLGIKFQKYQDGGTLNPDVIIKVK